MAMPTVMPLRSPRSGTHTPDGLDDGCDATGAAMGGAVRAARPQVAVPVAGAGRALALANGDALGPSGGAVPLAGEARGEAGAADAAGGATAAAVAVAAVRRGDVRVHADVGRYLVSATAGARAARGGEDEDGDQDRRDAAGARAAPTAIGAGVRVRGLPRPGVPREGTPPPTPPAVWDQA